MSGSSLTQGEGEGAFPGYCRSRSNTELSFRAASVSSGLNCFSRPQIRLRLSVWLIKPYLYKADDVDHEPPSDGCLGGYRTTLRSHSDRPTDAWP